MRPFRIIFDVGNGEVITVSKSKLVVQLDLEYPDKTIFRPVRTTDPKYF